MIHLVTQHGTGDTYMTLAFAAAVARVRNDKVSVRIKPEHRAIVDMFPDVSGHDLPKGWTTTDTPINCHPASFSGDISRFAYLDRAPSHADLWRAMLDLPLDEPMVRGQFSHTANNVSPEKVFVIKEARSWPNNHPEFWPALIDALEQSGRLVGVNKPEDSLDTVFTNCSYANWVIGPQCGVMAILCHALFPCRKTICTPDVDGTGWIVPKTYPYGYVTKFAGEDYDVDEVKITEDVEGAVKRVIDGDGGSGSLIRDIPVRINYGEFCDRLSILQVKAMNKPTRGAVAREYYKLFEKIAPMLDSSFKTTDAFAKLWDVNVKAWDVNERLVTDVFSRGNVLSSDFVAVSKLQKKRTELKNQINELFGSQQEVKSYYK
jgi:hypothetical protein